MNYIERYWRDATPEDAIKDPPMWARFKDKDEDSWHFDVLSGWNWRSLAKWLSGCLSWRFCQVYDAPDPGEGWRLIDIDNEKPQDGDEYFFRGFWRYRNETNDFIKKYHYRRRINPIVTYVPFTWEDQDQFIGRRIEFRESNELIRLTINHISIADGTGMLRIHGRDADHILRIAKFVDTDKPVGKEVAQ